MYLTYSAFLITVTNAASARIKKQVPLAKHTPYLILSAAIIDYVENVCQLSLVAMFEPGPPSKAWRWLAAGGSIAGRAKWTLLGVSAVALLGMSVGSVGVWGRRRWLASVKSKQG